MQSIRKNNMYYSCVFNGFKYLLCKYSIDVYLLKDLLGQAVCYEHNFCFIRMFTMPSFLHNMLIIALQVPVFVGSEINGLS